MSSSPVLLFDLHGTLADVSALILHPQLTDCFVNQEAEELCTRYTCILITAGSQAEVEQVFKQTSLNQKISFVEVITAAEGGAEKASGKPFLVLQEKYDRIIAMIGDSDADEQGARASNIPCIRIAAQPTLPEQQAELTRAIKRAIALS